MKFYMTHTNEYKTFFQAYIEGLKRLRKLLRYDSTTERIEKECEEIENGLLSIYNNIKEKTISENTQRMTEIEKTYKNTKNVYNDPQAEILKRQDFDLRFSMMERDEVIEFLSDEVRDFSEYELLKVKSVYGKDADIYPLLHSQQMRKDNDYMHDPEYERLWNDVGILTMIKNMGLRMVYLPTGNLDSEQYETFDLSFKKRGLDIGDIDIIIRDLEPIISQIQPLTTKNEILSSLNLERPQPKVMKYEEFDNRIFRGSEDYDEKIRFEWLKERFDDTTTDRFSPGRDDYDIIKHIAFLEGRLAAKLRKDAGYRERYRENMVKYTEQEDITTTVFSFTTGEYWGL